MERRRMLKSLLAGGLFVGLPSSLHAQQQRQPRPKPPGAQNVQPAGNAQVDDAKQPVVVDPKELERVLKEWEDKTAHITKLRGSYQRYEYDFVFMLEKRAVGSFWHETPDKGRIDFNVKNQPVIPPNGVNNAKHGPDGRPFQVEAASPETWVCTGKDILQIDIENKTYDQIKIPPPQRGQNIMDGPLPFLFGMKAKKLKARYQMTLGQMNGSTGHDGRKIYHLVAKPLLQADARNWSRAEVRLDAEYCLPVAIRLIDPGGKKETVYVFPLKQMKANEKLPWLSKPFSPRLNGFKLQLAQQAAPQRQQNAEGGGILPVKRTE